MKNNILRYGSMAHACLPVYLFAFLLLLASCGANEEDDLFPESAAQRLNHSVEYWKQILTGSPNGWALNYLIADGTSGGYVYTAKFTDEDVTMASADVTFSNSSTGESYEPGYETTSKYSVKAEQGVILSFDTYNSFFHYFSEPVSSSNPSGYGGDYEFILQRVSNDNDTIYLKGKKHGLDMFMYRISDTDTQTFTKNVSGMENALNSLNLDNTITVGNKAYPISFDITWATRTFTVVDHSSEDSVKEEAIFFMPDGFRLRNAIEINGQTIQTFKVDNAKNAFVASEGDATIVIPSAYEQVVNTKSTFAWAFNANEMDDTSKSMYATMDDADAFADAFYTAFVAFIGKSFDQTDIDNGYPYTMRITASGMLMGMFPLVDSYGYGINMSYDDSQQTLCASYIDKSDGWSDLATRIASPFFDRFLNNSPYRVELNDGAIKSTMRLTSIGNPDVWYTLHVSNIPVEDE